MKLTEKQIAAQKQAGKQASKALKLNGKAQKIVKNTIKLQECKQVYRVFKSTDKEAYELQGESTTCAMRKGLFAVAEKRETGKTVWHSEKQAQGVATFVGKDIGKVDGKQCAQAGRFIMSVDGWTKHTDWAAFTTYVAKHGKAVKIDGKAGKWIEGSKYSFYVLNGGKQARRHECNTCKRGAKYFATVN